MSGKKSVKSLLVKALKKLSTADFKAFKHELLETEPRLTKRDVEEVDALDLADLLIKTCTGAKAGQVTIDILNEIACTDDAVELTKALASAGDAGSSQSTSKPTTGASGSGEGSSGSASKHMVQGLHFIEKHQIALIQRVSMVEPILDHLMSKGIINQEMYQTIHVQPTSQSKMRQIMGLGNIHCGNKGKDILYEALTELEPFLMDDLKEAS